MNNGKINITALIFASFGASMFLALGIGSKVLPWIAAALTVLAAAVFLVLSGIKYPRLKRAALCVFLAAIAVFAGVSCANAAKMLYRDPALEILENYGNNGSSHMITAVVEKVTASGENYGIYECELVSIDGKSTASGIAPYPRIQLSSFGNDSLRVGDAVSFPGVLSTPVEVSNDGFEQKRYLESKHIFIYCEAVGEYSFSGSKKGGIIDGIRERMSQGLSAYIGDRVIGDEASVARCMLLGEKTAVSSEIKQMFRDSGISHILSVSGLHLSVLFYVVSFLLSSLLGRGRRRFPVTELISGLITLPYMAITGFTPSIMRAGFMLIFINIFGIIRFFVSKFKGDIWAQSLLPLFNSLSSLFAATALICAVSPYSVYDIGMQLSFLSTLGIILLAPAIEVISRKTPGMLLKALATSAMITLGAVSFSFPVVVYNFGTLSAVSVLSNMELTLIVTPLLAILLVLALLSLLPQIYVVAFVCELLGEISAFLCGICIKIAEINSGFVLSVIQARDNIWLDAVFVLILIAAVVFTALGLGLLSDICKSAIVVMYTLVLTSAFVSTCVSMPEPKLTLGTVGQRPYVCVSTGDERILLDSTDGFAARHHIQTALGDELYDKDITYVVSARKSSDFSAVASTAASLSRYENIQTVLVPTREICLSVGADIAQYDILLEKLLKGGFEVMFYEKEFTAGGVTFAANLTFEGSGYRFGEYSIVFADIYSSEYASEISDGTKYCMYFCEKAVQTDNLGYSSSAKLYITSPLYKKVEGAEKIPTSEPQAFLP